MSRSWAEFAATLTWTCHGCGDERPDAAISVMSDSFTTSRGVPVTLNLRYCNDRLECAESVRLHIATFRAWWQA